MIIPTFDYVRATVQPLDERFHELIAREQAGTISADETVELDALCQAKEGRRASHRDQRKRRRLHRTSHRGLGRVRPPLPPGVWFVREIGGDAGPMLVNANDPEGAAEKPWMNVEGALRFGTSDHRAYAFVVGEMA